MASYPDEKKYRLTLLFMLAPLPAFAQDGSGAFMALLTVCGFLILLVAFFAFITTQSDSTRQTSGSTPAKEKLKTNSPARRPY